MSTHIIRHDDPRINANIMTTTAAQANSADSINKSPQSVLRPTDHDSATKGRHVGMEDGRPKKLDKKSPEYLIKSGLAGGFAGCAVSVVYWLFVVQATKMLSYIHHTGRC